MCACTLNVVFIHFAIMFAYMLNVFVINFGRLNAYWTHVASILNAYWMHVGCTLLLFGCSLECSACILDAVCTHVASVWIYLG